MPPDLSAPFAVAGEQVYQLDKQKGFDGAGKPEGKQFTAERVAAGAGTLRDLIDSTWVESAKSVPKGQDRPPTSFGAKPGSGF